jgi:hypothetical protein
MDRSSLQAHGDNLLSLIRTLSGADLAELSRPAEYDATYFPVPGLLVRYPGWLVWPFAVLALLAVVGLAWRVRSRRIAGWPRLAAGFGLSLVPLLLVPVGAQLLWTLLVAIRPGYAEMLDPWRPTWYRFAVVALTAAILLTWYALLRRRIGAEPLVVGALGWLAVLGLVLAAATPGGSYLTALPALAGALAGMVALSLTNPIWQVVVRAAGAAVAILILAPTVLLFFPALGLAVAGAPAFFAVLLGLALLPVLEGLFPVARRRLLATAPAATAAVLALACAIAGLAVDRFDPEHPEPAQLMYALDADSGKARWVSFESAPGEWTRRYVSAREDIESAFPVLVGDAMTGPAPAAPLTAPELTKVSESTVDGRRTVTLQLTPRRRVGMLYFGVTGGPAVMSATVQGKLVSPGPDGRLAVFFAAPPPEGLTIVLALADTSPVTLRVLDVSRGLAELPGFTPRPNDVGVAGSHSSEMVLVAKTSPPL